MMGNKEVNTLGRVDRGPQRAIAKWNESKVTV